jgi:hypothetical protein
MIFHESSQILNGSDLRVNGMVLKPAHSAFPARSLDPYYFDRGSLPTIARAPISAGIVPKFSDDGNIRHLMREHIGIVFKPIK